MEYDDMDAESIVMHGHEEDEEMNPVASAFLRGYLEEEVKE